MAAMVITQEWLDLLYERVCDNKPDGFRAECKTLLEVMRQLTNSIRAMKNVGNDESPRYFAELLVRIGTSEKSKAHKRAGELILELLEQNAKLADVAADVKQQRDETPPIEQEAK